MTETIPWNCVKVLCLSCKKKGIAKRNNMPLRCPHCNSKYVLNTMYEERKKIY